MLGSYLIGGFFILIGLAGVAAATRRLWRAGDSIGWPTAPGEVLRSRVRGSLNEQNEFRYKADIEYRYKVSGREYTGTSVRDDGEEFGTSVGARELVTEYPEGQRVVVRFDPEDPSKAVLEPGVRLRSWWPLLIGIAFVGYGVAVVLRVIRPF